MMQVLLPATTDNFSPNNFQCILCYGVCTSSVCSCVHLTSEHAPRIPKSNFGENRRMQEFFFVCFLMDAFDLLCIRGMGQEFHSCVSIHQVHAVGCVCVCVCVHLPTHPRTNACSVCAPPPHNACCVSVCLPPLPLPPMRAVSSVYVPPPPPNACSVTSVCVPPPPPNACSVISVCAPPPPHTQCVQCVISVCPPPPNACSVSVCVPPPTPTHTQCMQCVISVCAPLPPPPPSSQCVQCVISVCPPPPPSHVVYAICP